MLVEDAEGLDESVDEDRAVEGAVVAGGVDDGYAMEPPCPARSRCAPEKPPRT